MHIKINMSAIMAILLIGLGQSIPAQEKTFYRLEATFPEDITQLWPSADDEVLVVTKNSVYIWKPGTKYGKLCSRSDVQGMLPTKVGWTPKSFFVWEGDTRVMCIRQLPHQAKPELISSGLRLCSAVDTFADLGFLCLHGPLGFTPMEGNRLLINDPKGKRLKEFAAPADYYVDAARHGEQIRLAVMQVGIEDGKIICRLLDEKAQPVWEQPLEAPMAGMRVCRLKLSLATKTLVVGAYRVIPPMDEMFQSELWLLSTDDGQLKARIKLPPPTNGSQIQIMRLSPDQTKLLFFGGERLGVLDLNTARVLWEQDPHPGQQGGGIRQADINNDGAAVAVNITSSPSRITLLYFTNTGYRRPFWHSQEQVEYIANSLDRSVFINQQGDRVYLRYGARLISVPFTLPVEGRFHQEHYE